MPSRSIAVLGGDARELRIAERLQQLGHDVRLFGVEDLPRPPVPLSATSHEAVAAATWVICPGPGIDGDRLYAPFAAAPVLLDEPLLAASDVTRGGLILGRASATVRALQERMGFRVVETKDERHLAIANATSVSEGLLRLLIERTDRTLREHRIVVIGYGATGAAITDSLLGARCQPVVVARNKLALERARQVGAIPTPYDGRVGAMATADIVINTVPDTGAIPPEAFARLGSALVVDIASPPGGVDHEAARSAGVDLEWARGLGSRAPRSSGDIRFRFIEDVLREHDSAG
jgi:dipicolinate synthase subunit A